MGLFKSNLESDIILSCEYIKVLLKNGEGTETIVYELSRKKFGKVSALFRKVIKKEKEEGKAITASLKELSASNINPRLKSLVSALLAESRGYDNLSDLSDAVVNDKKMSIDRLTRSIGTTTTWLVLLPIVPIFITVIDLLNQTMLEASESSPMIFRTVPAIVKPALLVAAAVIMIMMAFSLKFKKK